MAAMLCLSSCILYSVHIKIWWSVDFLQSPNISFVQAQKFDTDSNAVEYKCKNNYTK
jgi:hypothetical protein